MVTVSRLTLIKLFELILVCIIIGLHYDNPTVYGTTTGHLLTVGTFGGYLIILIGLFAGGMMGTPVNRRVDLFFSLMGCVLFIAAGALIIDNHKNSGGSIVAKGSLSIVEGILFFIDAVLTFRGEA